MHKLKLFLQTVVASGLLFSSASAMANTMADGVLQTEYPNNTGCFYCHSGSPGTLTNYGTAYVANGGINNGTLSAIQAIADLDSDGDGFSNRQEMAANAGINTVTLDVIDPIVHPYADFVGTKSNGTNGKKVAASLVAVNTAPITSPFTVADAYSTYGLTVSSVISDMYVQVTPSAGTINVIYSDGSPNAGFVVWDITNPAAPVDMNAAGTATLAPDGSIQITGLTIGTPVDFFVAGAVTKNSGIATPTTSAGSSSGGGCITNPGSSFNPMIIVMLILSIGYFRRSRVNQDS